MTDIKRHLPTILSCIRSHLSSDARQTSMPAREVLATLTDLLPASYGIGTGRLRNAQGQQSLPIDIILYDKTINSDQHTTDEPLYDLRQALLVITLANETDPETLTEMLRAIASVKALPPTRRSPQKPTTSATHRLVKELFPLGIVGFRCLRADSMHIQESLYLTLDALLKQQAEAQRPDFLIAQVQQLSYTNPLLDGEAFEHSTIHIACEPDLVKPRHCYICKQKFTRQHFFYTHLCLRCGDHNYQKRALPADMTGRVALVTGARVKIGYATALRMLRAGASVIVTTRFPHDAARRYSQEEDFANWSDRLHIYGLDLRNLPALERFIDHLNTTYAALDILINNAAQTIWRPPAYYAHLLPFEHTPRAALPLAQQKLVEQSYTLLPSAPLALIEGESLTQDAPGTITDKRDADPYPLERYATRQQPDLRSTNSWTQRIEDVNLTEMLEVQVINVTAPFLLVSRLRALLCRSAFPRRFIVNVSAAEGQFSQTKQGTHAHTNMAKAALNMLTHTAAADLARDGIAINSVDPGWISLQSPLSDTQSWEEQQQMLPLDLTDAAARVCDPIFMGIVTDLAPGGLFYKDYQPTEW